MAAGPRRRSWLLVGVAAVAIAAAGVGWVAGRTISSPADVAAQTEAPEASLITVPVELRELSTTVVVRGDVLLEGSFDIEIDASAGAETGGVAVTTGTPLNEGDLVEEGAVLVEVSERPVIVLQGELPMFRSLGPGSRGDDVEQLEAALERLGFDVGEPDEIYDEATEAAIEALYTQAGYNAAGLTDEDRDALDAARSAVDDARSSVTGAQSSLSTATQPVAESTRLSLKQGRDSSEDAVELAKAGAEEAKALAAAAVANAQVALDDATAALKTAQDRLDQANGVTIEASPDDPTREVTVTRPEQGIHPDTDEPPTALELQELELAVTEATNVLVAADADLIAAKASQTVVAEEQDGYVDTAEANLAIARAQYNELLEPADTTFESQAVTDAQGRLTDAEEALAEVEADTGVRVPRAEIVFVDTLPRRVQRRLVERGDIIGGVAMTVSGADVTIESAVSASDRPLLKVGDLAMVDDASLGLSFEAEITTLADQPGGRAAEGRYYIEFAPTSEVEGDVAGLNLRVTIPITSTGGEVMTVPLAALSAGADGSIRVEVETPGAEGETRIVTVTTGLETTGFVEVRVVDGELEPGDRVVVGR